MKAVILAGGEGTRLRPLTLTVPKPVVPVVDRPFLQHQLDLLARAGVSEVIFSVAYRPEKIQAIFGDGTPGMRIRYLVEDTPLGTGGAVKHAEALLDDTTIVLNGDVLTDVSLPTLLERHRSSGAAATLFLTPVEDPAAYGLVETDAGGRVLRFIEKPGREELERLRVDTINAGIYVLQTSTLGLMPAGEPYSIERGFFPTLLQRGERVVAHVHRGYWIDIGTPEKYRQVHRDVLHRRFQVQVNGEPREGGFVHQSASVSPQALLRAPFYVGPGCTLEAGAEIGPEASLVRDVHVQSGARVQDSVLWAGCEIGERAELHGTILALGARVGRHARLGPGTVLGERDVLGDYARTHD